MAPGDSELVFVYPDDSAANAQKPTKLVPRRTRVQQRPSRRSPDELTSSGRSRKLAGKALAREQRSSFRTPDLAELLASPGLPPSQTRRVTSASKVRRRLGPLPTRGRADRSRRLGPGQDWTPPPGPPKQPIPGGRGEGPGRCLPTPPGPDHRPRRSTAPARPAHPAPALPSPSYLEAPTTRS